MKENIFTLHQGSCENLATAFRITSKLERFHTSSALCVVLRAPETVSLIRAQFLAFIGPSAFIVCMTALKFIM